LGAFILPCFESYFDAGLARMVSDLQEVLSGGKSGAWSEVFSKSKILENLSARHGFPQMGR
jgi:hypothetical protein